MLYQVYPSWHAYVLLLTTLLLTTFVSLARPAARAAPAARLAHPMGCDADELWLDAQDWRVTTPGQVGRDGDADDDFGFLHTGLCFIYFLVQN